MATMHRFPNHILGKWMRLFCTMAEAKNQWTFSGTIDDWARVIGENKSETKKFILYMMDNFPQARVELSVVDNTNVYSVMDIFYKFTTKTPGAINLKSYKSSITRNRVQKMNEILALYHPEKMSGRNSRFKEEFLVLMRETSRGVSGTAERKMLELDVANEIIQHIKCMRESPEWKDPSKLLGLRDYIKNRAWAIDGENLRIRRRRRERMTDAQKTLESV